VELVPGAGVVEIGAGGVVGRSSPDPVVGEVVVVVLCTNSESDGNCTGLTNTMMQTRTTRQAPAIPSSLRLRSMAPTRAARKKPLNRKNNTMLTELLTGPAYQNPPRQTRPFRGAWPALCSRPAGSR